MLVAKIARTIAALALLLAACRVRQSTEPHEMSAAQHERAAERESRRARAHEQASIDDTAGSSDCGRRPELCWTIDTSEEHARDAEQHHLLAERHRAASAKLRDAEAAACGDVAPRDREQSPFAHRRDLRAVRPSREAFPDTTVPPRLTGAEIVFRAVPGMTAQRLQRLVDCHLARNAAIGHAQASEDMPDCPLTLAGVSAIVSRTGDGFAVAVTSPDASTAEAILARAQALLAEPASAR